MRAGVIFAITVLVIYSLYLMYRFIMDADKCPDCGEQMDQVYGWPKMECRNCGKTVKWG